MSIASVMPSSHLIIWCPLLLLSTIFPSIRDFSSESAVYIRWPNYWSFNFSISPSNKYSGLISPKIDWFDLTAVQGTLGSLLQHYISKASILWRSAFFMVQLSQPHVTTGNGCSQSAVISEPKRKKSVTTSTPSICHEVMGLDAMILCFFNI